MPEIVVQPAVSNTGSRSSIAFARSCLADCVTKHAVCNEATSGKSWYPTRLIEVRASNDASDPDGFSARLVETTCREPDGPYCALSHCWGKVELFKLLGRNLRQLRENIDLNLLPRTFLEAMRVILLLDVHYIWIDTLCIIQDSPDDWRHEASRMFEVYLYAHINVAATKAANATQGLFVDQNQASLAATVKLEHGPRPGMYQLLEHRYWSHMTEEAVLNQRAWVLQERLLSRRTLHFTDSQLLWDCCQSIHLETFKHPLSEKDAQIQGFTGPKSNQSLLSMDARDAENGDKWLDVVRSYSNTLLSYRSDKLFALSGLVSHFERLLGDSYCAGMWRRSMLFHLTWYTQQPTSIEKEADRKRAPSWSWLSYNGQVRLPSAKELDRPGYERVDLAKIMNVDVKREPSDDGDIFSGYLQLRAFLSPLSIEGDGNLKLANPVLPPFKADGIRLMCDFQYGFPTSTLPAEHLFYIPIWALLLNQTTLKFLDGAQIHGLILCVENESPRTYRRCAHACLFVGLTEPFEGSDSYCEAIMGGKAEDARESKSPQGRSVHHSTIKIV